jgi:hypothetical protein
VVVVPKDLLPRPSETDLCVVLQQPHPVLANLVPVHPGAVGAHVPQEHGSLFVSVGWLVGVSKPRRGISGGV